MYWAASGLTVRQPTASDPTAGTRKRMDPNIDNIDATEPACEAVSNAPNSGFRIDPVCGNRYAATCRSVRHRQMHLGGFVRGRGIQVRIGVDIGLGKQVSQQFAGKVLPNPSLDIPSDRLDDGDQLLLQDSLV
mgnify:CR=1 FL=1